MYVQPGHDLIVLRGDPGCKVFIGLTHSRPMRQPQHSEHSTPDPLMEERWMQKTPQQGKRKNGAKKERKREEQ